MVSLFALLFLLLAGPVERPRSEIVAERQRLYPVLWDLSLRAQNVPPEFAAWALTNIASSPAIKDTAWRIELIEEAFEQAQRASATVRLRMTPYEGMGSRAMLISNAHNSRLNRQSLIAGAIAVMAAIDAARAGAMFAAVAPPAPAPLTCSDGLWEDPAEYYETLGRLLGSKALTGDQVQNINALIGRVRSPVEVAPVARLLIGTNSSPAQRELLIASFAAALGRIEPDDRSFVSTIDDAAREMRKLLDQANPGTAGMALAQAWRGFLVRHLKGSRCADASNDPEIRAVQQFNELGVPPLIAREDQLPSKREGKVKSERVYVDTAANFNALMFQDGRALADQQKQSMEWQRRLSAHLDQLDVLQRDSSVSEAVRFYRVSGHLALAVTAAPAGDVRDRLVLQFIGYLQSSPFQQESFIEWFSVVENLERSTRSLHGAEHRKFERALIDSGHPVLALYARVMAERKP